jgi:hypothetical protein
MTSADDLLRSLPSHDVDPELAEHLRRRAHLILGERERRLDHPIAFRCSTYYHRYMEPAALIALGLCYLAWTVQDTVAILH